MYTDTGKYMSFNDNGNRQKFTFPMNCLKKKNQLTFKKKEIERII